MDINPFLMIGFMINSTFIEPLGKLIIFLFLSTWILGAIIPPLGRLRSRIIHNRFLSTPLLAIVIADFFLERILLSFLN